jgi:hypothetical protein
VCAIVGYPLVRPSSGVSSYQKNGFPDIDTARMLATQTMAGARNQREHNWLGWIEAGILNPDFGCLNSYFPAVSASLGRLQVLR